MSREKWDDAIREFSAALRIIPGDSAALLGRAYARKAKMADGQCARRALRDLLQLEKENPKGDWVEQRSVALEWMRECGSKKKPRNELRRFEQKTDVRAGPHFSFVDRQPCVLATSAVRVSSPIGHVTPVPPSPQYPFGFFARYCW